MNFEEQKQEIEDWKQSAIDFIEDLSMCDDWLIIDIIKNKSHLLLNMIKKMRLQDLKPDYPTCQSCTHRRVLNNPPGWQCGNEKSPLLSIKFYSASYNILSCTHHSELEES